MNNIGKYIDHTLLKPDATEQMIERLCSEAKKHGFYSVCVNSCHVGLCKKLLFGSEVKVCSVIGFPLGAMNSSAKAFEARCAVEEGAEEIDMVINIGYLKDKAYDNVLEDIKKVIDAINGEAILKVILETCILTDEEKIKACEISVKAGADFVKTSTGFNSGGATIHDVKLMKDQVAGKCRVKASGGIRTLSDFEKMILAGADRIGASSSVDILQEYNKKYK